jgi:hypothetical protein
VHLGRLVPLALPAALLCAAALAAPAAAAERQVTLKEGPFEVGAYSVRTGLGLARTPALDGFITHMEADVVDVRTGKAVPIDRIMLHHIVFANLGPPGVSKRQPFYGDGEERAKMDLPPGYGYPIAKADRWGFVWMLMNHRKRADRVYIRYRMTIEDERRLRPVVPMAWDTSHRRQGLVFDVPGGSRRDDVRTHVREMPFAGRIVAGLGHVHGGAKGLALSQPRCGDRTIYASRPTWGTPDHPFYRVRPVLHEPGPIAMSRFASARGIPVVAGQRVKLTSRYDGTRPHTRVMGLLLAYVAPDPSVTDGCGPMPRDVQTLDTGMPGRARTPTVDLGLYDWTRAGDARRVGGPSSPLRRFDGSADVRVIDTAFRAGNISVPRGARVRWTFSAAQRHNVTVAAGPEGFSSDRLQNAATFEKTFTRAGTYRLFCELHPVGMIQRVVVRR